MNTAATPDAMRVSDQPPNKSIGERKMPPPVPVSPDRSPTNAPNATPTVIGGPGGALIFVWFFGHRNRAPPLIRNAAAKRPENRPRKLTPAPNTGDGEE